jgi:lipid-binding SYLF domain-containing protein
MQRHSLLATAALALGAVTLAAPSQAAITNTNGGNDGGQPQMLIKNAVQAVQQADTNHHMQVLMQHAKAVFIVPSFKQGALIVGASGGHGVLLAREHDTWSDPAFFSVGSISIGAQAGGQAGQVIMLLMTQKALNDFENANNFSLNGKAGLTVANYSTKVQTGTNQDVIVWTNTSGASGGVSVSGSDITRDTQMDQQYYGKSVTAEQILQGKTNNLSADKLRNALPG